MPNKLLLNRHTHEINKNTSTHIVKQKKFSFILDENKAISLHFCIRLSSFYIFEGDFAWFYIWFNFNSKPFFLRMSYNCTSFNDLIQSWGSGSDPRHYFYKKKFWFTFILKKIMNFLIVYKNLNWTKIRFCHFEISLDPDLDAFLISYRIRNRILGPEIIYGIHWSRGGG